MQGTLRPGAPCQNYTRLAVLVLRVPSFATLISNFTRNNILIHSEGRETSIDRRQKDFSDLQFSISYQIGDKTLLLFILPQTNQLINKQIYFIQLYI